MTRGIYLLLDHNNTARYVGMSNNIEKRFKTHKRERSWVKKWLLLERVSRDENLRTAEIRWIAEFAGGLENKSRGANGCADDPTEQTRMIIAAKSKDHWSDPERHRMHAAKIRAGIQAIPPAQRRQTKLSLWANPEIAARMRAALRRATTTMAFREQQRANAMRIFARPEVRQKLRDGQRRRWNSAERARMSTHMRRVMAMPGAREAKSAQMIAVLSAESVREKMCTGQRARRQRERIERQGDLYGY